jgi:hypothetical protein
LIERQQKRGVAQAINEPALRHDLHPGADAGGAGADPHQAEITILECFKDPANQAGVSVGLKKTNIPGSALKVSTDLIIVVVLSAWMLGRFI